MNARLFLCIVMGVLVAHLGLFMFLSHLQPPPPPKPQPNFSVRSKTVLDQVSGERTTYREITVSTRLLGPTPSPATPALFAPAPAFSAADTVADPAAAELKAGAAGRRSLPDR